MLSNGFHDFRLDTFEDIDGKNWLYAKAAPDKKYEVVALLDIGGDETDDVELAAGGVVQLGESSFTTFMF